MKILRAVRQLSPCFGTHAPQLERSPRVVIRSPHTTTKTWCSLPLPPKKERKSSVWEHLTGMILPRNTMTTIAAPWLDDPHILTFKDLDSLRNNQGTIFSFKWYRQPSVLYSFWPSWVLVTFDGKGPRTTGKSSGFLIKKKKKSWFLH